MATAVHDAQLVARSLIRIRNEYRECPGLNLTPAQMRRLCGLDAEACDAVIDELVTSGFLERTTYGAYVLTHAHS